MGVTRNLEDSLGPTTPYGEHLLQFGEAHELAIYNGLTCWPESGSYTCHPHSGGHSVVDYLMGSPSSIPLIFDFHVSPTTLSDHSFLSFAIGRLPPPQPSSHPLLTRAPRCTFSSLYTPVYQEFLTSLLHSFPHDSTVETQAAFLSTSLHSATSLAFPSKPHKSRGTRSSSIRPPHPPWYDAECRSLHQLVTHARTHDPHLLHSARRSYRRTLRRKKRIYDDSEGTRLVVLLFSSSSGAFWREFIPRAPPPLLDDLRIWTEYATKLYTIPTDAPISISPRPSKFTFFTSDMVLMAIKRMKSHKARDARATRPITRRPLHPLRRRQRPPVALHAAGRITSFYSISTSRTGLDDSVIPHS
ncbi:hypothetical protein O6H91_02G086500 [Diphasiastrum complanatum]|uniref:Uncharacterized protein n=1 Tax=Diphasiastrum complanatum TaxID=34168 RepID=A0ACC2EHS4_DIPCM|nr:hypothetical protein O6H91_02G086500 [Diphasiastrum complanatum]